MTPNGMRREELTGGGGEEEEEGWAVEGLASSESRKEARLARAELFESSGWGFSPPTGDSAGEM